MKIKWVNDTHALGIFSSQAAGIISTPLLFVLLICGCICGCAFLICLFLVLAEQALSLKHPLLKIRPVSEGSQKAKWKAMRRAGRKDQELHLAYVQEETSEMGIEN